MKSKQKSNISRQTPISICLICLTMCLVFGCGYHLKPAGYPVGIEIKSLAIPAFSSSSSFRGFESEFTSILRNEFIQHSRVKLEEKAKAEAVLSGHLYSITTEPLTYAVTEDLIHGVTSKDEVTRSRTLEIRLDVSLTESATGKVIWQDSTLSEKADYVVSSDPLATEYNQRQALIAIARELATRIYSKTMERF